MKSISQYLFTFFLLLVIFSDEIFSAFCISSGHSSEKGMMQSFVFVISLFAYFIFIYDIISKKVNKHGWTVILIICVIIMLYLFTQIIHLGIPSNYYTYFYLLCSKSMSAAIVGIHLANNIDKGHYIDKILPFFITPLTIIIGALGWQYALRNEVISDANMGITYQSYSYWMAYFYTYYVYYIFFSSARKTKYHNFLKLFMYPLMIYSAMMCLVGGGRGAFVYIIFITIFLLYFLYKENKHNTIRISFIIILLISSFIYFSDNMNIWGTKGFERIVINFANDDARLMLQEKALHAFYDSPFIGQGVGSIWWTVGIYSHNLFTDLLAETGIIGTILTVLLLLGTLARLIQYSKINNTIYFLLFVFAGNFIQRMFSGYWLASDKIFLVCSFIYVYSYYNQMIKKNHNENHNARIRHTSRSN